MLRLAESPLRHSLDQRLAGLAREEVAVDVGLDVAGRERVDADLVARELERERLVRWISPAFEAAYAGTCAATRRPRIDAMLMIEPPCPCSFMCRATACATRQAPVRFTRSRCASPRPYQSSAGLVSATPALFTSIVIGPSAAAPASIARSTLAGSATSSATTAARPPSSAIVWRASRPPPAAARRARPSRRRARA